MTAVCFRLFVLDEVMLSLFAFITLFTISTVGGLFSSDWTYRAVYLKHANKQNDWLHPRTSLLNPGPFLATIFSLKIATWGGQYFLIFIFFFISHFLGEVNQHTNLKLFPLNTESSRPGTGNKSFNIFILIIFGIGFKYKSVNPLRVGTGKGVTTVQRASMKFDKWSPELCRFIGYPPARNILKGSNYLSVGFAKGIQTIFITVIVFSNEIFFFPYRIIVCPCQHS